MEEKLKIPEESMMHLNDEEIALYVQEMLAQRFPGMIPDAIRDHVTNCATCKTAVLELYHLLAEEPTVVEAAKQAAGNKSADEEKCLEADLGRPKALPAVKWYAVAAAAVIIIALSLVLFMNRKDSPQKLFTQYYSPYHDVVTVKNQAERNLLLDGLFYYNMAQYELAVAKFVEGLEAQPSDHDLLFYLASSYLATGNYEQAILNYLRIIEPGSKYYSPARWYLALAYLGANDLEKAQKLFDNIIAEGGFYAGKAGEIVERMR